MSSIYSRNGRLWCRLKGLKKPGKWDGKRTPFVDGQELEAKRYAERYQRKLDEKGVGSPRMMTVRAYFAKWIEERRDLDVDWKTDRGRMKNHVLPIIGDMAIANVRTSHILEVVRSVRVAKGLAPRTVRNVYSVMAAMFRDAKIEEKIEQSPCVLDDRHLGAIVDKDPEWRATAFFQRDEVETIISDHRIPEDRRVQYSLEFLAGVRHGEAAALRLRHYDRTATPLGKLLVAKSYNTRKHREKATKTESARHVPVHQVLAEVLGEWLAGGWERMMGRKPGPDDLLLPLPPRIAARRRTRRGDPFRGHDYSGKRWREDLELLELRHRRGHDARATFITLALDDGADPDVIERRVTHTKKSRGAFDGYNRGLQWERTCSEVAKLKIARRLATRLLHAAESVSNPEEKLVEAAGVERTEATVTGRIVAGIRRNHGALSDSREPSRLSAVARLATRLASAVLAGDQLASRRLAEEMRALDPAIKAAIAKIGTRR